MCYYFGTWWREISLENLKSACQLGLKNLLIAPMVLNSYYLCSGRLNPNRLLMFCTATSHLRLCCYTDHGCDAMVRICSFNHSSQQVGKLTIISKSTLSSAAKTQPFPIIGGCGGNHTCRQALPDFVFIWTRIRDFSPRVKAGWNAALSASCLSLHSSPPGDHSELSCHRQVNAAAQAWVWWWNLLQISVKNTCEAEP